MSDQMVCLFIQARMSSSRFPGKVLAPLNSRPMIAHVIDGASRCLPQDNIVVATSDRISDDPLAYYVEKLGIKVIRGSLDDVFSRFRLCLEINPCDWFFRISADSPLLNSAILRAMIDRIDPCWDLITNVQKRTFPHGHSVELLNAAAFTKIKPERLSAEEREHVTKVYYAHPDDFRILNFENTDAVYGQLNFVVDTIDDLRRVEKLAHTTRYDFMPSVAVRAQ